jgi:ABC-type multidrug transport system fused ATPase/permease subunit
MIDLGKYKSSGSYILSLIASNLSKCVKILILMGLAAMLEASFLLLFRYFAMIYSRQAGQMESMPGNEGKVYLILGAMALLVTARTVLQVRQFRMTVALVLEWAAQQRNRILNKLNITAFPFYRERYATEVSHSVAIQMEDVKKGLLSWFFSISSLIQLMVFLPLIAFFPWQLGVTVFLLLIPAVLVSRLRIKALNLYGSRWVESSASVKGLIKDFFLRSEDYAGNGNLSGRSEKLIRELEDRESHQNRWEFVQAIFPQVMEVFFFLMIAGVMVILVHQESWVFEEFWQVLPFLVLLLMMYKPVREWSRHYPAVALGRQAWNHYSSILQRVEKKIPRPDIELSSTGKLEVSRLSFSYDDDSGASAPGSREEKYYGDQFLFEDFNLKLDTSSVTLVYGANGTGKSTLLKLIARLEFPKAGGISYPEACKTDRGLSLAYLPQQGLVDVMFFSRIAAFRVEFPEHWQKLDEILGLSKLLNRFHESRQSRMVRGRGELHTADEVYDGLSGGEQQRLRLAQVFITDAHYLLLDEPMTWLPGEDRFKLMQDLSGFWLNRHCPKGQRGMLIASHEPELKSLCDVIVELEKPGRLKSMKKQQSEG